MQIKVAVVGPADLVNLVMAVGREFPNLQMEAVVYKQLEETVGLVERVRGKTDIFLFSGPIPYQLAKKHDSSLPMVYIPYTGAGLYRALFQLTRDNDSWEQAQHLRLSIDVLEEKEVRERMTELEFSCQKLYIQPYQTEQTSAALCRIHQKLWREEKIDAIVTCVTSVYEMLHNLGVPCYRIIPTRSVIRDALKMTQLEGEGAKFREAQLVIGTISVGGSTEGFRTSEYITQRRKLEVQQILLDLSEKTRKLIYRSDGDNIMFVTTRGVIEEITDKFTRFPLLDELQDKLRLPINMGVGIGYTAGEAEGNADQALSKAEATGASCCYAVLQNGAVMGPIGRHFQLDYCARSYEPEQLAAAKTANLSVGTINKLCSLSKQVAGAAVTASEVANWFDITFRSARRILAKLEKSSLAVVVGAEQPINKGRPRRLYKLHFPAAQLNLSEEKN